MTIEELGKELGVSVYYINHHFKGLNETLSRVGKKIIKNGKGMSADYGIIENNAAFARFDFKGENLK